MNFLSFFCSMNLGEKNNKANQESYSRLDKGSLKNPLSGREITLSKEESEYSYLAMIDILMF